jgi:hypothetical protein
MGAEKLTDYPPVVDIIDAHEDNGIISHIPNFQRSVTFRVLSFRNSSRGRMAGSIEKAVGQMLEEVGLAPLDPQVVS